MSRDTWRHRAKECIRDACLVWADIRHEIPRASMPDKEEFVSFINRHYPWGQRKGFPYKVWLSEMQHLKRQLWPEQVPIGGLFAEPSE